jgi:hypothetical protein
MPSVAASSVRRPSAPAQAAMLRTATTVTAAIRFFRKFGSRSWPGTLQRWLQGLKPPVSLQSSVAAQAATHKARCAELGFAAPERARTISAATRQCAMRRDDWPHDAPAQPDFLADSPDGRPTETLSGETVFFAPGEFCAEVRGVGWRSRTDLTSHLSPKWKTRPVEIRRLFCVEPPKRVMKYSPWATRMETRGEIFRSKPPPAVMASAVCPDIVE